MIGSPNTDDQFLIQRCLDGDADSYAALVDRYKSMAYTTAYRMVGDAASADDIAQESFIAAYKALAKFRRDSRFSTWLYSIVMNKSRDFLRAERETVGLDEISDVRQSPLPSPERTARHHQERDALQQALDQLPRDYREVLILKHIEELEYQEISRILAVGVPALKVRAHRGREMLKRLLTEMGAQP